MKKVLSLVLALAMVLGSFSFVSAAPMSDVTDPTLKKAVDRLSLLEVLTGYPDGTFKPGQTITRAEFAAVAVRVKGLAEAANAAKGLSTGFNDVTAAHWASGFVGTAAKLGIVNGVGNGLFAPEAPVKYEEAITMIVRALGYEAEAQTKGGYPYGYLIVANDRGLLDDVKGTQGTPASRGIVAQITDNALEIPKMIQVGFGTDAKWVVSGSAEHGDDAVAQYLLNDLGVDEIKGKVTNNFRTKSTVKADEIEIDGTKYDITDSVDVDAVLGVGVTAWAKDDVVFSITLGYTIKQSGKDVVFDEDQVIYDTVVAADTNEDEVKLYVLDDEYDWASRAKIFVNNSEEDAEDIPDNAYGRFVLNEDDEIEFAYLFNIASGDAGLTTAIDENDLDYWNLAADEDVLALDDAEEIYVFNKDLSAASLDDIAEDTAIFFWIDSDDNYYIIADNNSLEGNLDAIRIRDTRVTVAGTNVKVKDAIFSSDDGEEFEEIVDFETLEDYVDEDVVLYYNLAGDALAIVTGADATSGKVYGVATWLSASRNPELTVYNGEGKEVEYTFEDRAEALMDDISVGKDLEDHITGVSFKVNKDGEIKEESYAYEQDLVTFVKDGDDKFGTVAARRLYITEDTVILKALNSDGELKPSVIKYDDIIGKDITDHNQAIIITGKGNDLALLIFVDKDFEGTDDTEYGILTSDPTVRSNGDYRAEIDVAGEGKATYTIKDSVQAKGRRSGDLIRFKLNTKGEVNILQVIDLSDNVDANVNRKVVTLKDGNTITVTGETYEYRRTSDTVFYQVDKDGKFDGTTSYGRIASGSTIILLANDKDEVKVVMDLTPHLNPTGGSGSTAPKGLVTYNGKGSADGNTLIFLGDKAYVYTGPESDLTSLVSGTDKVTPTIMTIRGEQVVTKVVLYVAP